LEIKATVKAEWPAIERAKFVVFRHYVQENYSFENFNVDETKKILSSIMAEIHDTDTVADGDVMSEDLGETEPTLILMDEDKFKIVTLHQIF
jgi:hypothetical protein